MRTDFIRRFSPPLLMVTALLLVGTSARADLSLLSSGQQEVAIYTIVAGSTVPGGWEEYPVPLTSLFDNTSGDVSMTTTTISPKPPFGPNNTGTGSEITINTAGVYRVVANAGGNGACNATGNGAQMTLVVNGNYLGSSDGNQCGVSGYEFINKFNKGDVLFFTMRAGTSGTFQAADQAFTRFTVERLN